MWKMWCFTPIQLEYVCFNMETIAIYVKNVIVRIIHFQVSTIYLLRPRIAFPTGNPINSSNFNGYNMCTLTFQLVLYSDDDLFFSMLQ